MNARRLLAGLALVLSVFGAAPALAADPVPDRAAVENRARELGRELRCLVCQNQSIEDSDAPLAADLRAIVREKLMAGDDESQIKRFLVERYGDFVLLKPPFKIETLLLWGLPLLGLAAGVLVARRAMRRAAAGPRAPATADLSAEEQARLQKLLDDRHLT